jgi:Ni/Co efflux regulator RcnB
MGLTVLATLALPAQADRDKHKHDPGHGHHEKGSGDPHRDEGDARGPALDGSRYFREGEREHVRAWYSEEFRRGNCPPGLAKKHNGCLPPGQARRWRVGQPLDRDLEYHDLPPALLVTLSPAPSGYHYVRVANDILLIAAGTGMVLDALQDLGLGDR